MFQRVTKGALSGKAGQPANEDFKINGQYVDTRVTGREAWSAFHSSTAMSRRPPWSISIACEVGRPVLHQCQLHESAPAEHAAPDYMRKSMSKSKYADSVVELDARIGRIMDKMRSPGLDNNTLVFYTTDNGAWQDVYPDAGYTPFRGTKGTVREGGNRVPAIAWMPGKMRRGKNHESSAASI